jgi:hypothetical protein
LRRLIAALGIALILLLGTAAVSPGLHHRMHSDGCDETASQHSCAVVLFASGVTLMTAAIAVPAPRVAWHDAGRPVHTEILLVAPRYLRQPERGPPGLLS